MGKELYQALSGDLDCTDAKVHAKSSRISVLRIGKSDKNEKVEHHEPRTCRFTKRRAC